MLVSLECSLHWPLLALVCPVPAGMPVCELVQFYLAVLWVSVPHVEYLSVLHEHNSQRFFHKDVEGVVCLSIILSFVVADNFATDCSSLT